MKNAGKMLVVAALGVLSAGLLLSGCKSGPELTQAQAQALIQAKYDQTPAVGANVVVNQTSLGQGMEAGLWTRTKVYPNRFWADFALTPEGKKAVTLPGGGDVIQWRAENVGDKNYSIVLVTVAANHLKARDLRDVSDDAGGSKGVEYFEAVNLDGAPTALINIAHNPGNSLGVKRHAHFVLDGGAWKLDTIK